MARTKTGEKATMEKPKKKSKKSARKYLSTFIETNYNKKSLEISTKDTNRSKENRTHCKYRKRKFDSPKRFFETNCIA